MWYDEMFEELEKLGNEEQSIKMAEYMKNKFPFLGIPKPELRAFIKPYLAMVKKQNLDWKFVYACWDNYYREAQYVALDYLMLLKKKVECDDLDKIKYLIITKSWWETVDQLDAIVGLIIMKNTELEKVMLEWSVDDNIWLKRVAIDYQQEFKQQTNKEMLTKIICNNFGSNEFFINKAIGWSLREYSKVNPEWVKNFIEEHKEKMAPLSIKEASRLLQ